MPFRDVLQPSFRGRLRLFFLVIVLVPLVAVAVVLFVLLRRVDDRRVDARLSEAESTAAKLLREREVVAGTVVRRIARDGPLAVVLQRRDRRAVRVRLQRLAARAGARQVRMRIDGLGVFRAGRGPSVGVASAPLASGRRAVGRLTVGMEDADAFTARLARLLTVQARITKSGRVIGSSFDTRGAPVPLPRLGPTEVDGEAYRVASFPRRAFGGGTLTVALLTHDEDASTVNQALIVLGAAAGFLVLASAFALIVSRALQSEVDPLLVAAQRLGAGDFSVHVPTEGSGEFSSLGKAFNTMARQLEGRLEELERERGRLQDAIRRVGESFARGLDREGLLEIVVQTAVEGIGASGGRATIRDEDAPALREVARAGRPEVHAEALRAAETAVLQRGKVAEVTVDGASALAAPLGSVDGERAPTGVVSVARPEEPFTADERELFAYLASQAGLSVENVDLHETVQRQAVTDELTGLFNHRRFQEVMTAEVERARRFGHELGLIMLDIDNFKRVNDTYGHMQGDLVLREVAQVLRDSAREIDEPARYGGEEMTVALPQTDLDGAYNFAERVRHRIETLELPLLEGGGILRVTASFGAASLSAAPGQDKDTLVAAADAALYRAKRSGKNRTVRAE